MHPALKSVASSNIAGYRYNPPTQQLVVAFLSGDLYVYEGVPQNVADGFDAAGSKGSYLNGTIKSGGFSFHLVDESVVDGIFGPSASSSASNAQVNRQRQAMTMDLVTRYPFLRFAF